MHSSVFYFIAALAISTWAASTVSLSSDLIRAMSRILETRKAVKASQVLTGILHHQDNPAAKYLTQTDQDGHVTGQRMPTSLLLRDNTR